MEIIIIIWGVLVFGWFVSMGMKAYYHFEYLKLKYPERYNGVKNYFDYSLRRFDENLFILPLPYFNPKVPPDLMSEDVEKIIGKVKFAVRINLRLLAACVVFLLLVVVFSSFNWA